MGTRYILYHESDADGWCSAAIAARHALLNARDPVFVPVQYGRAMDWGFLEDFDPLQDQAWLVDFTLPSDDMSRLLLIPGEKSFVWIDHHKSELQRMEQDFTNVHRIPGLRDPDRAACMLTWVWAFTAYPPPPVVSLVADRDTWAFEFGEYSRYLNEWLHLHTHSPDSHHWERLFVMTWEELTPLFHEGENLLLARVNWLTSHAQRLGIPNDWPFAEGKKRVLSVNLPGSGDLGQVVKDLGYSAAHCWVEQRQDGKRVRVHSLYSDVVDCAAWAQARGGGGHKGAAGWVEVIG